MRSNKTGCRGRIKSIRQMSRQDDRLACTDEIVWGAEGIHLAGGDILKGLAVVGVAKKDLFKLSLVEWIVIRLMHLPRR